MLTAKLLVRLGAPLQLKSGELPPVQPKPLNTCSLTIVPPSLRSELVRSCFAHSPHSKRAPTPSTAIRKQILSLQFLPYDMPGIWVAPLMARAIAIFGIAWQLKARAEVGFDGDPSYRYGFSVATILVHVA